MSCFNCQNCKQGLSAYYCLEKNDFVISETKNFEKVRTGWKKGNKNYESHRRKSRKEVEI